MKKGKKVYTLKIWYNDATGECTGLCEYIDKANSDKTLLEGDEPNIALEFISDCIPEKYIHLINCCEIGVA